MIITEKRLRRYIKNLILESLPGEISNDEAYQIIMNLSIPKSYNPQCGFEMHTLIEKEGVFHFTFSTNLFKDAKLDYYNTIESGTLQDIADQCRIIFGLICHYTDNYLKSVKSNRVQNLIKSKDVVSEYNDCLLDFSTSLDITFAPVAKNDGIAGVYDSETGKLFIKNPYPEEIDRGDIASHLYHELGHMHTHHFKELNEKLDPASEYGYGKDFSLLYYKIFEEFYGSPGVALNKTYYGDFDIPNIELEDEDSFFKKMEKNKATHNGKKMTREQSDQLYYELHYNITRDHFPELISRIGRMFDSANPPLTVELEMYIALDSLIHGHNVESNYKILERLSDSPDFDDVIHTLLLVKPVKENLEFFMTHINARVDSGKTEKDEELV